MNEDWKFSPIAECVGRRLIGACELDSVWGSPGVVLFWEDRFYSFKAADYEDDWSDVTPGDGWQGFDERPLPPYRLDAALKLAGLA
jgi:hypothetical protein